MYKGLSLFALQTVELLVVWSNPAWAHFFFGEFSQGFHKIVIVLAHRNNLNICSMVFEHDAMYIF